MAKMSSNWFSRHPRQNANANLKRRSNDIGYDSNSIGDSQGFSRQDMRPLPPQKRGRTQMQTRMQFESANAGKLPLYNNSVPRVSHRYDSNVLGLSSSYGHVAGSIVRNNVMQNHSPVVSVSSEPMNNSNHKHPPRNNLSDFRSFPSELWRRKQEDNSFDLLPEWDPNESTPNISTGFVPTTPVNNFPKTSLNSLPDASSGSLKQRYATDNNANGGYRRQECALTVPVGAKTGPVFRRTCDSVALAVPVRLLDDNRHHLNGSLMNNVTRFPNLMPTNQANVVSVQPQVLPKPSQSWVGNDLSDLLSTLKSKGLISLTDNKQKQNTEINNKRGDDSILGLEFDASLLKVRQESVINALYSDLSRQCATCGQRFKCQEDHRNHMDWHVRKNRTVKDMINQKKKGVQKTNQSRKWFASAGLWLSAVTEEPLDDKMVAALFSTQKENEKKDGDIEFMVPADDDQKTCALCKEPFEDFFSDEADEWMYKGAVYLNTRKETRTTTTAGSMEISRLGPIVHAKCMPETGKAATKDLREVKVPVLVPSAGAALVC